MEASTSTILKQKLTSISNSPYPPTVSPPMSGRLQETRLAERARQEARLAESLASIGPLEISIAILNGLRYGVVQKPGFFDNTNAGASRTVVRSDVEPNINASETQGIVGFPAAEPDLRI